MTIIDLSKLPYLELLVLYWRAGWVLLYKAWPMLLLLACIAVSVWGASKRREK